MAETIVDWPAVLPLPLQARSHHINSQSELTVMETERVRVRRRHLDPLEAIEYQWHFMEDDFDIFKTFFEVNLANGQNYTVIGGYEGGIFVSRVVGFYEPYRFEHSNGVFTVSAVFEVIEE